ncbi:class I glutamine amidotransferase-like protein [Rickenella mellea]|uniref:Class I glutamine amidotransferase-like protein n=1 Tax=Rickenella mellea TaxID=50990 RepID=A0A4Y7PQQ8_9AGAM|nr:class I glutamine amidotransferase-like protein [Rickenella mellea]
MAGKTNAPLQVGILLLPPVQLLDVAAVDLLGMFTPEYVKYFQDIPGMADLSKHARAMEFHYITEAGPGSHAELTGGVKFVVTDSLESVGRLDILVVPGPEITYKTSPAVLAFLRQKYEEVSTLFTICSGVLPVASAGILTGKAATGPLAIVPMLRAQFPDVKWEEKRWVHDGKIWSSGGITNGLDMMAAYVRENFPAPLAELVCKGADVGDRGVEYGTYTLK